MHSAWAALYAARVTISDPTAPTLQAPTGELVSGDWQRGRRSVTVAGADVGGIKESRVYLDERATPSSAIPRTCDYTYVVPCTDEPGAAHAIDTARLPDGRHRLKVSVVDAAGNESASGLRSFDVDNTAPLPPVVRASTGAAWTATNAFDISWSNAGEVSPIASVRYRLCPVAGGDCVERTRASDVSELRGLSLPSDGEWNLFVARTDAAGNVGAYGAEPAAVLRLDRHAPAAPVAMSATPTEVDHPDRPFRLQWEDPVEQASPIVAVHHRVCAAGRTTCGPSERTATASAHLDGVRVPDYGSWEAEAWLEDAAGNVEPSATASVVLRALRPPAPVPSPSPSPSPPSDPEPAPGGTPGPGEGSGATSSPTPDPNPVATPQDTGEIGPGEHQPQPSEGRRSADARSTPGLRLSARRLGGRLLVSGSLDPAATKALVLRLNSGRTSVTRRLPHTDGRFRRFVRLPRRRGRLTVVVSYPGDPRLSSQRVVRHFRIAVPAARN